MHVLIIGGSDAGISSALRAHELDPSAEVSVVVADSYPNFSVCGLPYYLSGATPDWRSLAHRTEFPGLNILRDHTALSIDAAAQFVAVAGGTGVQRVHYDRLIVATGARPVRPAIEGSKEHGVFVLRTMGDSFAVHACLEQQAKTAVIVGAGYIGLEMADALRRRGLGVTLLSRSATVLPTVDPELGLLIQTELSQHGVALVSGVSATRIEKSSNEKSRLLVHDSLGGQHLADLVILAVGAQPNGELAAAAGAQLGRGGALQVNRAMRTNLRNVFAAGDCVETYHRLFDAPRYLSLGTVAHKQGRVAGENSVETGMMRQFAGSVGTQSLKVFGLAVARTGVGDAEGREAGFDPITMKSTFNDHKAYYPGATRLFMHVTGDRRSGRLLGAQIVGAANAEVSKRIDIFATALFQGASIEAVSDFDLSYTPPFSSPWDPVQMAAQEWVRAHSG